jgi:DNA invertase Pin-like site-specific DNA recombinase
MVRAKKSRGVRAVIYIRVSTVEQAEEGHSMAGQEERLRAYCAFHGLEVVEAISDPAKSAFKPLHKRRGGKALLDLVKAKKVDVVVSWKLDRVFRNAGDCLNVVRAWDEKGIAFHVTDMGGQAIDTSSAMGRFFLTMMAGAAELERNHTSERTRMALDAKAKKGELRLTPKAPYGYRYDGDQMVPDAAEQAVIERIRSLRGEGVSLRGISARLASEGLLTRTGRPFAVVQLERIFRGPKRLAPAE